MAEYISSNDIYSANQNLSTPKEVLDNLYTQNPQLNNLKTQSTNENGVQLEVSNPIKPSNVLLNNYSEVKNSDANFQINNNKESLISKTEEKKEKNGLCDFDCDCCECDCDCNCCNCDLIDCVKTYCEETFKIKNLIALLISLILWGWMSVLILSYIRYIHLPRQDFYNLYIFDRSTKRSSGSSTFELILFIILFVFLVIPVIYPELIFVIIYIIYICIELKNDDICTNSYKIFLFLTFAELYKIFYRCSN